VEFDVPVMSKCFVLDHFLVIRVIQYWFISYLLIKFKHKYRENLKIFKNWFVRFCGAFAFGPQVQHISSATKLLSYDPKELQENPMLDVHPKRRTNGHGYQLLLHHSSQ